MAERHLQRPRQSQNSSQLHPVDIGGKRVKERTLYEWSKSTWTEFVVLLPNLSLHVWNKAEAFYDEIAKNVIKECLDLLNSEFNWTFSEDLGW